MPTDARPKKFALIGAAGFVAPRHMRAIKHVGGELVAAFDPADSVGIIDDFFPDGRFFVELERFDRYVDKLRRRGESIDYVSICSPNYLHDAHVRFALRSGCNAICEKPLVLNPWNIDGLAEIERTSGRRVNTILQLRLHPTIVELRTRLANNNHVHDVDLTYVAARGRWYDISWKGDEERSGGIATNIGIHFFDMLTFLFGPLTRNVVHHRSSRRAAGYLDYERARVRWFLSIAREDLPASIPKGQPTFRSLTLDGEDVHFSNGFDDLHTVSYREILKGNGHSLDDARPSIEAVSAIRSQALQPTTGDRHPLLASIADA